MTPSEAKGQIRELTQTLNQAREQYYHGQESPLEDDQYDFLLSELVRLEGQYPDFIHKNSPTLAVGAAPVQGFPNVVHQTPMYSLDNVFKKEELLSWLQKTAEKLDTTAEFVTELKIDGLSISLIYKKGKFTQAITRGNGEVGDDVTASIQSIQGLPLELKEPHDLELRGEVYMTTTRFDELNKIREEEGQKLFMNPRNAAAGAIRLKDVKKAADAGLSIWVYDAVQGVDTPLHSEVLDFLQTAGFPVNPTRLASNHREAIFDFCMEWEEQRASLSFPIDGMVIKLNDRKDRRRLGFTAKSPRWAVAWKFKEEVGETELLSVENSIGRTGMITPVAYLKAVEIQGSVIQKASLHNYEQVAALGIMIGDQVKIAKKGEIIPQVLGFVAEQRPLDAKAIVPPTHCPSCQGKLKRPARKGAAGKKNMEGHVAQEVDLYCFNPACPAQLLARLEHFTSRAAMDIREIGPALVETLVKEGLVSKISDLFRLGSHQERLKSLERYGEKSIENVLASIETSKTQSLNQFIFALGIRQIGKQAAKTIAYKVGGISEFAALSAEKLEKLPEFGEIMQNSLKDWLALKDNQELLRELIELGVQPTALSRPISQPFFGQTVVITGTLTKPRKDWQFELEEVGFKVSSAVSAKTNYLLAGESAGSKLKKAQEKGVSVVTEDQMQELIQKRA